MEFLDWKIKNKLKGVTEMESDVKDVFSFWGTTAGNSKEYYISAQYVDGWQTEISITDFFKGTLYNSKKREQQIEIWHNFTKEQQYFLVYNHFYV